MTLDDIAAIVAKCLYPDYAFHVKVDGRGAWYLQAEYDEADIVSLKTERQRTRRWFLSPEMVPGEVVQTCFKCIMTSMEHRVREHFTYRQRRVFGPHFDIERLWEIAETARLERPREDTGRWDWDVAPLRDGEPPHGLDGDAAAALERRSFKGRKNAYTCGSCGCVTVTIDRDAGVTPFMIKCRRPDGGCSGMAQSAMYRIDQNLAPAFEWYAPDSHERAAAPPAAQEHYRMGGLALRPIAREKPDDA